MTANAGGASPYQLPRNQPCPTRAAALALSRVRSAEIRDQKRHHNNNAIRPTNPATQSSPHKSASTDSRGLASTPLPGSRSESPRTPKAVKTPLPPNHRTVGRTLIQTLSAKKGHGWRLFTLFRPLSMLVVASRFGATTV